VWGRGNRNGLLGPTIPSEPQWQGGKGGRQKAEEKRRPQRLRNEARVVPERGLGWKRVGKQGCQGRRCVTELGGHKKKKKKTGGKKERQRGCNEGRSWSEGSGGAATEAPVTGTIGTTGETEGRSGKRKKTRSGTLGGFFPTGKEREDHIAEVMLRRKGILGVETGVGNHQGVSTRSAG